jgi:uncharacterized protein (DUF736 family)
MSEYDNTNTGMLTPNFAKQNKASEKDTSKWADWSGKVNVEGKEFQISAWKRVSQKGTEYFSLKISEPFTKGQVGEKIYQSNSASTIVIQPQLDRESFAYNVNRGNAEHPVSSTTKKIEPPKFDDELPF